MNTSDLSTQLSITSEMTSSSPDLPLRLRWIIKKKKIILWLKLNTAVKETDRKRHLLAVNSLCGPCGAYVHTRSCSQTRETCTNKSKLIVMHFPSAKKFNYDGCDGAIQGSRLNYWLVPLRLKRAPWKNKQRRRCIWPSWSLSTFLFFSHIRDAAQTHLSYFSMHFRAKKLHLIH